MLLRACCHQLGNNLLRSNTCHNSINSANVLEDLQWSTLDVRRHRLKSVLMYKILNEQSALSKNLKDLKDLKDLKREYNLRLK